MKPTDKAEFAKTLNLAYETQQRPLPSASALNLWVALLEPYSIEQVRLALAHHMRESKFAPVPADVITRIPKQGDGRPGVEEAWAIALTSRDERATVVWTDETFRAFQVALPVLELGDEVGARMAFKDAYARIVAAAQREAKQPAWSTSLGWDPQLREVALQKAANAGLLPSPSVEALSAPKVSEMRIVDENLKRLRAMAAESLAGPERVAAHRAEKVRQEAAELAALKAATAQRVAVYAEQRA